MRLALVIGTLMSLIAMTAVIDAAQTAAVPRKAAAAPSAPVNLNTATAAQIESLPGIGASTAKRIIEYRDKNGGYKKIEELMNVKGIGEKSFLRLKPHITVGESRPPAKQ